MLTDDQLETAAAKFERLGLKRYGVTFEEFLDEPDAWERIVKTGMPVGLRRRLMRSPAPNEPTPIGEMLQLANIWTHDAFRLSHQVSHIRAEAKMIEVTQSIKLLESAGHHKAANVLRARRALMQRVDNANKVTYSAAAAPKADA